MKTTLTIEESARLIDLGVDSLLATSMKFIGVEVHPIFGLADILSILPKEIMTSETIMGDDFISELQINWDCNRKIWRCSYLVLPHPVEVGVAPELIDALYQLLIWCMEQGYIKSNTKKKE